jgi:hypothetical protein
MKKLLTIIVMFAFAGVFTSYSLNMEDPKAGAKTECAAVAAAENVCDGKVKASGGGEAVKAVKTSAGECSGDVKAVKASITECGDKAADKTAVATEAACCSSKAKSGSRVAENK